MDTDTLNPWVIVTSNGARIWYAEDQEHALEQHADAFTDDPNEEPIHVVNVTGGQTDTDALDRIAEILGDSDYDGADVYQFVYEVVQGTGRSIREHSHREDG